jgi:hypothetical protein
LYTFQKETLPGFHDALMDLSDGVAQSDIGRALESAAPGITRFSMAVANGEISQEEYVRRMQTEFGPRLQQFAGTLDGATLDVYRSRGGFYGALAQLADGAYEFSNLMNIDVEAAKRDQNRRNRITETLGRFEQGIIALRTFLFTKFINSPFATKIGEFGEKLIDLFDENNPNGLGSANRLFDNFFETLFGENGYLTRALNWLANFIDSGRLGTALEGMATAITTVVNWFVKFMENITTEGFSEAIAIEFRRLMNFMFGERGENDHGEEGRGERTGGLVSDIISSITESIEGSEAGNNLYNWFKTKWNDFVETIFSNDTTSLWTRFTTSLGNFIFGEEEGDGFRPTPNRSLWERFQTAIGLPEGVTFTSLWEQLRTLVFGEDADNDSNTSIVDRIVKLLDDALGRIFSGPSFQLMLMDVVGTAELMVVRVLNQIMGMRGDFDERIADLERQRSDIGAARAMMNNPLAAPQDIMQAEEVLRRLGVPGYNAGTNGFRNFGSQGSLALLHNTEAVVPRNSPAGELLDAFYKTQENRVTSTSTSTPTFNQSDFGNKIDQLNNTMQQVVVLLSDSVGVQRRTMRNIHGMGTDLLRG